MTDAKQINLLRSLLAIVVAGSITIPLIITTLLGGTP
jgi:hypothetical protein